MNSLCTALIQEFRRLAQLGAAHDGVVNEKQALVADQGFDRNQLHARNEIALRLTRRHERARPCGRVFDERAGKGNAGTVGIADGMRRAGIRHTGHQIAGDIVAIGKLFAAVVTHLLHVHTLIGGSGIAVVHPEERADLHSVARLHKLLHALCRDAHNLAGAKFPCMRIAKVHIGKVFKGDAVCPLFFADGERCTAPFVAGRIDAVFREQHNRHGAVHALLHVLQPFHNGILLADERSHQFRGVDTAAAHFEKVGAAVLIYRADQILFVVHLADGGDGKAAQVRLYEKRLGIAVRNAADAHGALQFLNVALKLRAERGVFDVVYGTAEPIRPVNGHTTALRPQMGMIIRSEEQIQHTTGLRHDSKHTAHR